MGSSTVCVDASFIVRLFLGPDEAAYWELLEGWNAERTSICAPGLVLYEVCNAFYRLQRAGYLSQASTELVVDAALSLPIRLESDAALLRAALRIAASAGSPAAYDAQYLALAERLGAELFTADARLARQPCDGHPTVRLVGATASPQPPSEPAAVQPPISA